MPLLYWPSEWRDDMAEAVEEMPDPDMRVVLLGGLAGLGDRVQGEVDVLQGRLIADDPAPVLRG